MERTNETRSSQGSRFVVFVTGRIVPWPIRLVKRLWTRSLPGCGTGVAGRRAVQAQSGSQQQALVIHLVLLSLVVGQGGLPAGMQDNGQINIGYRSYVEGDINGLGGIVGLAIGNRQDVSIEKPPVDQSDLTLVEGET